MLYITREQLDELSEEEFLDIEKWKVDNKYGSLPYKENGEWKANTLSIGQMIEYLKDDLVEIIIKNIKEDFETIIKPNREIHIYLKDWRYNIPALWEAVKYKVKQNITRE